MPCSMPPHYSCVWRCLERAGPKFCPMPSEESKSSLRWPLCYGVSTVYSTCTYLSKGFSRVSASTLRLQGPIRYRYAASPDLLAPSRLAAIGWQCRVRSRRAIGAAFLLHLGCLSCFVVAVWLCLARHSPRHIVVALRAHRSHHFENNAVRGRQRQTAPRLPYRSTDVTIRPARKNSCSRSVSGRFSTSETQAQAHHGADQADGSNGHQTRREKAAT